MTSNPTYCKDQGLTICSLASGSKGNALYISNGCTAILVDAGLSGIEIERRLQAVHLSAKELSAIVVSHEHSDHIQAVGVLSRRYKLPVHISAKTAQAAPQIGKITDLRHFDIGSSFAIGDLTIHPFATSHDAEDPAGFTVSCNSSKIGIVTDLGIATRMVKHHLQDCTALVLEANHDLEMLIQGPYPWPLKQRIRSHSGHLSNEDSRDLLSEIKHNRLHHVILAHLSETNNTPAKALQTVQQALTSNDDNICLHVAHQRQCSAPVKVNFV